MDLQNYRDFTVRLQLNLESDLRVLGLVALGSMAEQRGRVPDDWSDHDFFVITTSGEQESFRQNLNWLPDGEHIVLTIRETAHGLKVFYAGGHLLEFAVFDESELATAKVNDYRVLFERAAVSRVLETISRPPVDQQLYNPRRDFTMVLALCFVGVGRYQRGEQLSAHAFIKLYVLHHLLPLLVHILDANQTAQTSRLDNLDPFRRFEQAFPDVGAQINRALLLPIPQSALALIHLAEQYASTTVRDYPEEAVSMVREYIQRSVHG